MVAGLPGFGLSGAFFVVSALLMLPIEVVSTIRGRSSLERWGAVLRSAAIALSILAGLELTYAVLHFAVVQLSGSTTGAGGGLTHPHHRTANVAHMIPVLPVLGTLGLVAVVTISVKAAEILTNRRRRPIRSGPDSATSQAEMRSHRQQWPTSRPHPDHVQLRPVRRHAQPDGAPRKRVANETTARKSPSPPASNESVRT
jgi:hypothetical protein